MNKLLASGFGRRLYKALVLTGPMPYMIIALSLGIVGFFAFYVKDFKMDASSDSLTLENDKDLEYYDESRRLFVSDDYVFVVLTSAQDLFSEPTLQGLRSLSEDLSHVEGVASVTSILKVPLFQSPPVPLLLLAKGYKTLEREGADRELARKELTTSPLFSNYIISPDGKRTILQVNFKVDAEFTKLTFRRYELRDKARNGALSPEESAELGAVEQTYRRIYQEKSGRRDGMIREIRGVLAHHASLGTMHLGGVPMIVSDMVQYIRRDILIFGGLVLVFIVIIIALIFRRLKLFLLPTMVCMMTLIIMVGYLGYTNWHTTVVTANFTSLLLIVTTENAILLASKWRENLGRYPEKSARELAELITVPVLVPCGFSTFTTIIGFSSLVVSGIRPVMDFGLMMTLGLIVGFLICFLFMPAMLAILPKERPIGASELSDASSSTISVFARIAESHPSWLILATVFLLGAGYAGTRRLTVENKFQDYFRKGTAIYGGMDLVDRELGGTTPLEVVLTGDSDDYWLQPENLAKLRAVHQFMDDLPETGKVISLDTMVRILEGINKKPLTKPLLSLVRSGLPKEVAKDVLDPYVTPDFRQARITMRIQESTPNLRRKELLDKIYTYLEKDAGFKLGANAHVTGVFLLYNNMLQTLFTSEIATVGSVFITCFLTFWLIFRNFRLALMGLAPNIVAVTVIMGAIGWLGIPLDMMTIMIAAVTFGLADDNTIQYIHAFQKEFPKDRDYKATMYRCHNTIGRALSYSMITIVFGFAVMTLSNFLPTVYFGIFTGIAMFLALVASHSLLPMLILLVKPLGPDADERSASAGG